MSDEVRFKKISTKDKKVIVTYEKNVNGNWDEYSFSSSERAKPSFYEAIKKLAPHVIDLCELPSEYLSRIEAKGVSFSYGGDMDVMGATITASMELDHSNCNLNLNTPHKPSAPYNSEQEEPFDDQCLSDECVACLDNLCYEAQIYIDGEREQISLFPDNKGETKELSGRPDLKIVKSSQPTTFLTAGKAAEEDGHDPEDDQPEPPAAEATGDGDNPKIIDVDVIEVDQEQQSPDISEPITHGSTGTEG